MSGLAFFRNPTGNVGVLCDSNFDPLSLHGVRVSVAIRHGVPIVTIGYEYRNQTAASQKVFAAFPVPKGWRLLSARAEASMGNNFVRSLPPTLLKTAAPLVSKGVATLQVPWSVMVGQFVVVQAIFLTPPIGSTFVLPKILFPSKIVLDGAASGWRGAFAIQAPCKFKQGFVISINGTAVLPLSAAPSVNVKTAEATLLGDPKGFRLAIDLPTIEEDVIVRFPFRAEVDSLQMQVATVLEANRDVVDESKAFAVATNLNPSFTSSHFREPNAEFIFILGLGNGISVADVDQVKDALHATIAGLPPSCCVNVVCCTGQDSSKDIWMSKSSLPIGSGLLEASGEAAAFLKKVTTYAHSELLGGVVTRTAMKRPSSLIGEIISTQPFTRGLARNIIVITTDGGDTQAALTSQIVMANQFSTSVSSVALSHLGASDEEFLKNLAVISNGLFMRCNSSETIISTVLELVSALAVPALTQINIHYTDSNSPTSDGSSAPTVDHCGFSLANIPFIRAGSDPQWLYAFAKSDIGQLTVKIEGLIGTESMQYAVKTPKAAISSCEQSSCTKGNSTTLSPAHLMAAALKQDELIRKTGNATPEVAALTAQFGIPTYASSFSVTDETSALFEELLISSTPNPNEDFVLGRKSAMSPEEQAKALSVVSTGGLPFANVATDRVLRERLVQFGEAERNMKKIEAQKALDARKRKEKAIGIDDQEAAEASYAFEQLQIDSMRNTAAEYLGGGTSFEGGGGTDNLKTADFFRAVIQELVGIICEPVSVNRVLQVQQLDGSLSASSFKTLAAIGVTREVFSHIPSTIATNSRAEDIWLTIIALARVQNDSRSVLFQRKARSFLSSVGVEPDKHEAFAQHVLASS